MNGHKRGFAAIVNAAVGRGCVLSVGSIVDHDSVIGDFCHVNTGAICMAGSTVEPGRKVGAGEVVSGFNQRWGFRDLGWRPRTLFKCSGSAGSCSITM